MTTAVPPEAISSHFPFSHAMAAVYFPQILPSWYLHGHSWTNLGLTSSSSLLGCLILHVHQEQKYGIDNVHTNVDKIIYSLDNFYLQRNGGTGKLNNFLNTNHLIQGSAEMKPLRVRFSLSFLIFFLALYVHWIQWHFSIKNHNGLERRDKPRSIFLL